MTLQDEMLDLRVEYSLSQREAAMLAGITLQTWNQVERGLQNPSRLTEAKIKKVIERGKDERDNKQN